MSGPTQSRQDSPLAAHTLTVIFFLLFIPAAVSAADVIKSANDDREYRYFRLPNQLEVLLISDPESEKAAAALDVFVGSASDPDERAGLAHFLEHMLFLGTEKYPEPSAYQDFINEHGGSHNAYTSFEHTNYFFDVNADYLAPALDRFAQFFISPLFAADYVERERHAVHSEYQARLKDEYRRNLDVLQEVMNPDHPLAGFSIGSLATLSNEDGKLRADLIAFFGEHYQAGRMALVVTGKQNLDVLQDMVEERFSGIPNRKVSQEAFAEDERAENADRNTDDEAAKEPLFLAGDLPMLLFIEPEKEQRQLALLFPAPSVDSLYRKKPAYYLGNLLGHEGQGSLLSVLKAAGWAEALHAGLFLSSASDALFRVNISLTEAGLEQRDAIISLVFAAIDRIRRDGVEQWRFEEVQQLGEIAFRFQEKTEPLATARSLAPNLHYYDAAELISGDYLLQEYDPELIKHFLGFLNPGNMLVAISAPGVEAGQQSDYFATPYRVERGPIKVVEAAPKLLKQLKLPDPNPFIPEDFSLEPEPVTVADGEYQKPILLRDAARMRAWFKQDEVFEVPRASIYLRLLSPQAADSLKGATLMQLYVEMVRDALNEFSYPASLAGLFYSLQVNSRGLDVIITGYDDAQDELLRRLLQHLRSPRFSGERFGIIRRELLRDLQNQSLDPPYEQLMAGTPALLFSPWWSRQAHIEALQQISFADLRNFSKTVFADSRAEMLIYGNVGRLQAAKLAGRVEVELLRGMAAKVLAPARVVKLQPAEAGAHAGTEADAGADGEAGKGAPVFVKDVPHSDTAALFYVQGNDDSLNEKAYMMLLRQVLRPAFFHQLRTEQQLGYVVFAAAMPFKDVPGTVMVVQSPAASGQQLMRAIKNFNRRSASLIPDELAQHKRAVANELLEEPRNLHEQASRYWSDIVNAGADFEYRTRLAEAVLAITAQELRNYLSTTVLDRPRALWLLARPAAGSATADKRKDDPAGWLSFAQWSTFKGERGSYIYP